MELAKAYVQIIPSMRGAQGKITSELKGLSSSSGVSGAGKKIGTGLATAIGKTMKVGLVTGAAATGAVMGTALTKGFGRLRAFEQAEQSLKGMGLAASEVAVVMENANAAVDGTAYGLDAAATAAKSMVAAGVEPGKELQRVLTLVGDSAAQAGVDFDKMGVIWSKVFAKGKLQGDEAMQLMEAGIPIYQLVADQMGITAEEAMELGRKGEISADMFATAIESKFGGSALAMGATVTGASQNFVAALGRLGQGVLAGPFADLPALFTRVRDEINEITPTVSRVSESVYEGVKQIGLALAGSGTNFELREALGLTDQQTGALVGTLTRLRIEAGKVGREFSVAGQSIRHDFAWIGQTATFDGLLGTVERLAGLGGLLAGGVARLSAALSPVLSYAGQASAILGGALLTSLEALVPPALDLAVAVADAGASMSSLLVPAAVIASNVMVPLATVVGKLADVAAELPGPVLAAGLAFASIKTGLGPLPKLVGGAEKAFEGLRTALDTLKVRQALGGMEAASGHVSLLGTAAASAKGKIAALGGAFKTAFVANLPLLAISGAVALLGKMASASARNQQEVRDLASSFDELGGATEQTREQLVAMMRADENWAGLGDNLEDRLNAVGVSTREATDALMEGGQAVTDLQERLHTLADAAEAAGNIRRASEMRDMADAIGKMADEYDGAADSARKNADASEQAARASREEKSAIEALIDVQKRRQDQLLGVSNSALAAREAQRSYNDAVENAASVIADETASYSQKEAALDAVAQAVQRNVVTAQENRASQEELNAMVEQGKEAFVGLADQTNFTTAELEALWAEIGLAPDVVVSRVEVDTRQAWTEINGLKVGIDETTGLVTIDGNPVPAEMTLAELEGAIDNGDGTVTIDGNSVPADMKLDAYLFEIARSSGDVEIDGNTHNADEALARTLDAIRKGKEDVTIDGETYKASEALAQILQRIRGSSASVAVNAYAQSYEGINQIRIEAQKGAKMPIYTYQVGKVGSGVRASSFADGGIVKFFASGGFENRVAQIAPAGAWRVWAEPETGGEAYIPLALSKRRRSMEILREVARQFGHTLVPREVSQFSGGGITRASSASGGFPSRLVLQVDGREFTAYVKELADGRIASNPGVAAANGMVRNMGRYRAQMGV